MRHALAIGLGLLGCSSQLPVDICPRGDVEELATALTDGRWVLTLRDSSGSLLERVETPYQSPQPPLWAWEPGEWLSVVRVAPYAPRQPRPIDPSWHLPLPMVDAAELGAG